MVIPEKSDEEAIYCQHCGSDFIQVGNLKEIVSPNQIPTYSPKEGKFFSIKYLNLLKRHTKTKENSKEIPSN